MEIESISYLAFASLTRRVGAIADSSGMGCAWYAAFDARAFGRIHIHPSDGTFGVSVWHFGTSVWHYEQLPDAFDLFADAEAAMFAKIRRASGRKAVTVSDIPMKMRRGLARNRPATGNAKPY